jgi:hypothetical protein
MVLSYNQRKQHATPPGTLLMIAMRGTAEGSCSTTCFAAIEFHAEAPHQTLTRAMTRNKGLSTAAKAFIFIELVVRLFRLGCLVVATRDTLFACSFDMFLRDEKKVIRSRPAEKALNVMQ